LDADDQWHAWSRDTLVALEEPVASTETAVAEAAHQLRHFRPALQALMLMLAEGRVRLQPVLATRSQRIGELLAKYRRMDLGDATLVALSEQIPRARLVTVDRRDFTVYRRKDGRPVPCIMPPE
jgi:predicted nucleic acid-binding protein